MKLHAPLSFLMLQKEQLVSSESTEAKSGYWTFEFEDSVSIFR